MIGLVTIILICIFMLNGIYVHTALYKNNHDVVKNYLVDIPYDLEFVNLGSTYARYAFDSYEDLNIKGYNFALESQALNYDYEILKTYCNHMAENCIVFIPLAACVMFFQNSKDAETQYYYVFKKNNIGRFNWKSYLKYKLPLFFDVKVVLKKICIKILKKEKSDTTVEQAEMSMNSLVLLWKKMFGLENLTNISVLQVSKIQMTENGKCLDEMIRFCEENHFKPVIVIPPFSKYLNKYFSEDFVNETIYKNIKRDVMILDYRNDSWFQEKIELYSDGGFLLNKQGSKLFMKKLFNDVKKKMSEGEKIVKTGC